MNKEESIKDLDVIKKIISKGEIVRLSTEIKNKLYTVPLNYGYEISNKNLILYCHCNHDIKKIDSLIDSPNINVEIVDKNSTSSKISNQNKVQFNGKVEYVNNIYDKIRGLNKIMQHSDSLNSEIKNKVINNIILIKIICDN